MYPKKLEVGGTDVSSLISFAFFIKTEKVRDSTWYGEV